MWDKAKSDSEMLSTVKQTTIGRGRYDTFYISLYEKLLISGVSSEGEKSVHVG